MSELYNFLQDAKETYYYYKNEAATFANSVIAGEFGISESILSAIDGLWHWVKGQIGISDRFIIFSLILLFIFLTFTVISKVQVILKAKRCQVEFAWNELRMPQIGEIGILKIWFLQPMNESVQQLFEAVSISVTLDHEEILTTKEAKEGDKALYARFQIQRCGQYEINITYEGYPIRGSPFTAIVDPDEMNPSNMPIDWPLPIILVQGKMSTLEIIPRDRNGDRCSARLDCLCHFQLQINDYLGSERFEVRSAFCARQDTSGRDIISLNINPQGCGSFFGKILLNGIALHDEELEFLSLSTVEETMILEKEQQDRELSLGERSCNFTAFMDNEKEVLLELSPRFFYLKDTGFLQARIATFRVCRETLLKIQAVFGKEGFEMAKVNIIDKVQNLSQVLEMLLIDARIFVALVAKYCSGDVNDNSIRLETKRGTLYQMLRDRYPERPRVSYKILQIKRDDIFESTLQETKYFNWEDWGKQFIVSFSGEPVNPIGLAWVSWTETLMESIFENNSHGMFCSLGSTGLLHPNSNRSSRWRRDHYELAGKLVGKYIVETAIANDDETLHFYTNARFTRSFLAQMLSLKPTFKHMELDDPEFFASTMQPVVNGNVRTMNLKFTGPVYDAYGSATTRELIQNGQSIPVTTENKLSYLNALANLRLAANVQEEVEAFVEGLTSLVPHDLLMSFDENELELVMCGSSLFTLRDIQINHMTNGTQWDPVSSRIKEWLWHCLQKMSSLDIGRFLQFATGSSRLPPGGLAELKPSLKINVSGLYGQLPTSNKVLHQISLTDHPTVDDFNLALLAAIRGGDENSNQVKKLSSISSESS